MPFYAISESLQTVTWNDNDAKLQHVTLPSFLSPPPPPTHPNRVPLQEMNNDSLSHLTTISAIMICNNNFRNL